MVITKHKFLQVRAESGFTLVELVVVIVIIGIISYFSVAKFTGADQALKDATAMEMIAAHVRYAQQVAVADGEETRVIIDQSGNRYYLTWSDGSYLKKPIGGTDFIITLGSGEFSGVSITSTSFGAGRLDFKNTGEPLNNGSSFTGDLTLVAIGSKNLKVRSGTGLVFIEN